MEHRPPLPIRPKARETVATKPLNTLWERQGWVRQTGPRGDIFVGQYRVWEEASQRQLLFAGRIEADGGLCQAYVQSPPESLLRDHPKRLCFRHRARGWYHMNWWQGSSDVSETISYVEKTLAEAVNCTYAT